jgi:hypothetical protein
MDGRRPTFDAHRGAKPRESVIAEPPVVRRPSAITRDTVSILTGFTWMTAFARDGKITSFT